MPRMTGLCGMKWALALAAAAAAGAAPACLPPLEGAVEPTEEERIRHVGRSPAAIVYGVVTRSPQSRRGGRFRVMHVYRGALRPGTTIPVEPGWGLNPPPCFGMMTPPPVERGARGVIVYDPGLPWLNFASESELALMFRLGIIAPGPHDRPEGRPR